MEPLLSIVIPTYNRPERVAERLQELVSQCSDECEILVLDNASDVNVEAYIRSRDETTAERIRFHRNPGNVGLAANICRAYEVAQGRWVWTLGDDDQVEAGAVAAILDTLKDPAKGEAGGFNFSTGICIYPEVQRMASVEAYAACMRSRDVFSNALFLSSCVFRRDVYLRYLRIAYLQVASAAPHIAVPFHAIADGIPFFLIPAKIVSWEPPDETQRWNALAVGKSLPLLGEMRNCDPVLDAFVEGYLMHMPGELRLKVALRRIFAENGYSPAYWQVYYARVSPYLKGWDLARSILVVVTAALARSSGMVRALGSALANRIQVKTHADPDVTGRL
jgi:glycosyltransferase involved in cell wall biosynthesis